MDIETLGKKKTALEKAYNLQEKTETFRYRNTSTLFDVKIALAQGFDEDGTDDGMAEATGLVTIANELKPGESNTEDISHLNCKATRAECSIIWRRRSDGEEVSASHADQVADQGNYFKKVGWKISDPSLDEQAKGDPTPIFESFAE